MLTQPLASHLPLSLTKGPREWLDATDYPVCVVYAILLLIAMGMEHTERSRSDT